ncbi:MAG: TonB-dependent receptor [Proteobacteria bacterium]|nr:TonB-dependent receptor [Pseudomonadota bacterium]
MNRLYVVVAALLLGCALPAFAQSEHYAVKIEAQPIAAALKALAAQTGLQILVFSQDAGDKLAPALNGELTADEALTAILGDSGLTYEKVDARTVAVRKKDAPAGNETDRSSLNSPKLEEVVVTAQKRTERLQDVPVPVAVVTGNGLVASNQLRLQDFYSSVPGLVVSPGVQSGQQISIRGIAPGIGNPTVGVTVDDVPYGASATEEGGLTVPDIDPNDLDHVEVLRGPQGTLYGASTMGGLIKFVTVDPSTKGFAGTAQLGTNAVQNGAQPGYSVRGSVNVPVTDDLALRASAFTRQDPGYIDNPVLHIDGINEAQVFGGHLSTLWQPDDSLSVKLSALFQNYQGHGVGDVNINPPYPPPLGDLQQNYVQGVGPFSRKVQAYSAIVRWKPGELEIVSISGFNINSVHDSYDLTSVFGPTTQTLFGVTGTPDFEDIGTHKYTQEIRASSTLGSHLDWLVGGFYTHEAAHFNQTIYGEDPLSGPLLGVGEWSSLIESYEEYAAFGDLTVKLSERFDIQLGARQSHNKQTLEASGDGGLFGLLDSHESSGDSSFTYLFTPRFRFSPNLMVYARIASGYRAGGPNNVAPGVPLTFQPDTTRNYEIGTKATALDGALAVDASLYYIDWKDIQISEAVDVTGFVGNGGRAKSQGVELSVDSRPLPGLTVSGWISWNDAVLTEDLPPAAVLAGSSGASGDRLPLSGRVSGTLSIQQSFPLWQSATGFAGASVSYVDNRLGNFAPQGIPRLNLPADAKTDLRGGIQYGDWGIDAYVNNLTNRRGLLNGGSGTFPDFAYVFIQPRTVGVTLKRSF